MAFFSFLGSLLADVGSSRRDRPTGDRESLVFPHGDPERCELGPSLACPAWFGIPAVIPGRKPLAVVPATARTQRYGRAGGPPAGATAPVGGGVGLQLENWSACHEKGVYHRSSGEDL